MRILAEDLILFRDGEGRVRLLTHEDGLPTESILAAFIDRRGVLWVAIGSRVPRAGLGLAISACGTLVSLCETG